MLSGTNISKRNSFTTSPQIDWLTLQINYCRIDQNNEHSERQLILNPLFSYKIMPYNTRVFKRVIEIFDIELNEVVATITDQPISPAIRQDLILIKFHNKLLYTAELKEYVELFCKLNNFEILGISRLDIAVDFKEFSNRLHPSSFIDRFLHGTYVKKGQGKYKVAGKYQEIESEPNYISQGSYGKTIRHEYLRFGTNNNGLKYYIYNKSKELRDVKLKPYIIDRWRTFGYDDSNPEQTPDIWRLEFSITSNDIRFIENTEGEPVRKGKNLIQEKLLVDPSTGEATTITEYNVKSLECLNNEVLEKIWSSLVNKYMVFYKPHKSRKTRGKQVKLFNKLTDHISYSCVYDLKDSTNTDKNFIRNLRRTYEDTRNKDFKITNQLERLIKYQIHKRGLTKWANEKDILNFTENSIYNFKSDSKEVFQQKKDTEAKKTRLFNKEPEKPPE